MSTFPDGLYQFGGVPVSSAPEPVFGKVWFVDGTNGNDGFDGFKPTQAKKTIQAAITAQIANTTSLGDAIYVFPGSYAESLTGDLTKVQIIGVNAGGYTHAVSVRPTASYAYYGTMFEATFKNIMFLSPSTSNKTYPAVQCPNMRYSVIDNCLFIGRDSTCVEGLQIGNTDEVATAANCDYNQIINNTFTTFYGAASQFAYGIKVGRVDYDAGCSVKQCWGTLIANNTIFASTAGIYLGIYGDKSGGTVIRNNYVACLEDTAGPQTCGIGAYAANQAMVVQNYVASDGDAIKGFQTSLVLGNWVSLDGTAAMEGPAVT
jgi:hypothetical protein